MPKIIIAGSSDFCAILQRPFASAGVEAVPIVTKHKIDAILLHADRRPDSCVVVLEYEAFLEGIRLLIQKLLTKLSVIVVFRQRTAHPENEEREHKSLGATECIARVSNFHQRVVISACAIANIGLPVQQVGAVPQVLQSATYVSDAKKENHVPSEVFPNTQDSFNGVSTMATDDKTLTLGSVTIDVLRQLAATLDALEKEFNQKVEELNMIEANMVEYQNKVSEFLDQIRKTRKSFASRKNTGERKETSDAVRGKAQSKNARTVEVGGVDVMLPPKEAHILSTLVGAKGKNVPIEVIVGDGEGKVFGSIQVFRMTYGRMMGRLQSNYPEVAKKIRYQKGVGYSISAS